MTIDDRLRQLDRAPAAAEDRPVFFDLLKDEQQLAQLVAESPLIRTIDRIDQHVAELIRIENPSQKFSAEEMQQRVRKRLGERPSAYGVWVYYPWLDLLCHVLRKDEYLTVRADRNRYKITPDEQQRLRACSVGLVGLSVGHIIALTMAMEGVGGHFKLADFDELSLGNTNRVPCGNSTVGMNKARLAARKMYELDPYLEIEVFTDGVTDPYAFVDGGRRLDIVVEECDNLAMKLKLRYCARELGVPLVMETNEQGMLDIERYDLEPQRQPFHGLLGDLTPDRLEGLNMEDKVAIGLKILGDKPLSPRMAASLLEIDQTITGWSQLGSGTVLGGAVVTDTVRRILLGELSCSGRFYVNLAELVADQFVSSAVVPLDDAPEHRTPTPSSEVRRAEATASAASSQGISVEQLRSLVEAATLAPSGGNCQPWLFEGDLQGGALICHTDATRAGPFLDFRHCASISALGAAVENIVIAAGGAGLAASIEPLGETGESPFSCRISFSHSGQLQPDPLIAFIPTRMTNRKPGERQPLTAAQTNALLKAASDRECELIIIDEEARLAQLGKVLGELDRMRVFVKPLHKEVLSEIRWSRDEVIRTADGIDIDTLELNRAEQAALRMLRYGPTVSLMQTVGGGRALTKTAPRFMSSSAAACMLRHPRNDAAAFFAGGRAMQRVWLTATSLGLAFQPWSACTYMFFRLRQGGEGYTAREAKELQSLGETFDQIWGTSEGCADVLLFRLTHAPTPEIRALRRPVSDVFTVR
ncbi:MAG: Rv1355c family protein [Deltaproteobacteria bacterium]|nr:Rv1355c family protein [Deltaproteobacteria bacterium]